MINLPIKHFSQLDNQFSPTATCNITCVAMCLYYYGVRGDKSYLQLEDQLYKICERKGLDEQKPFDLKRLVEEYSKDSSYVFEDNFTTTGTFEAIKKALDVKQPCIVHGYFTPGGHIIVIRGYDDKGFFVNDPYGEYYPSGYDTSKSGENLHYSYKLIANICSPESVSNPKHIYLHRIYKDRI